MKKLLLSILAIFLFVNSYAQPAVNAKKQAEIMATALGKQDYNTFSIYTHPKILSSMGGKQKMIETLKKGLKEMADGGASFKSMEVGEVSEIYKVGTELQCTIRETVVMQVTGGTVTSTTALLGFSNDQGKNWKFADINSKTRAQMKAFFPNLGAKVVFPEPSKPVFKAD